MGVNESMNKLAHLTFLRVAGLAAGAAAVSGAVVLVSASAAGYNLPFLTTSSSPSQTTSVSLDQAGQPSALCTDFLTHLSADLKASPAALNAAYQKAVGETLADEVKSGKLTQARADAIQKRLAGKAPCAIAAGLQPRPGLAAFRPALLSAEASALGISDQTLKADLKKGMSLVPDRGRPERDRSPVPRSADRQAEAGAGRRRDQQAAHSRPGAGDHQAPADGTDTALEQAGAHGGGDGTRGLAPGGHSSG